MQLVIALVSWNLLDFLRMLICQGNLSGTIVLRKYNHWWISNWWTVSNQNTLPTNTCVWAKCIQVKVSLSSQNLRGLVLLAGKKGTICGKSIGITLLNQVSIEKSTPHEKSKCRLCWSFVKEQNFISAYKNIWFLNESLYVILLIKVSLKDC